MKLRLTAAYMGFAGFTMAATGNVLSNDTDVLRLALEVAGAVAAAMWARRLRRAS